MSSDEVGKVTYAGNPCWLYLPLESFRCALQNINKPELLAFARYTSNRIDLHDTVLLQKWQNLPPVISSITSASHKNTIIEYICGCVRNLCSIFVDLDDQIIRRMPYTLYDSIYDEFERNTIPSCSEEFKCALIRIRMITAKFRRVFGNRVLSMLQQDSLPICRSGFDDSSPQMSMSSPSLQTFASHMMRLLTIDNSAEIVHDAYEKLQSSDVKHQEILQDPRIRGAVDTFNQTQYFKAIRIRDTTLSKYIVVIEAIRRYISFLADMQIESLIVRFESFATKSRLSSFKDRVEGADGRVDEDKLRELITLYLCGRMFDRRIVEGLLLHDTPDEPNMADAVIGPELGTFNFDPNSTEKTSIARGVSKRKLEKKKETYARNILEQFQADQLLKEQYIREWPHIPEEDTVLKCINDYRLAIQIDPGIICCVCSTIQEGDCLAVSVDNAREIGKMNLSLLNRADYRERVFGPQHVSDSVLFSHSTVEHPYLSTILIDDKGVTTPNDSDVPELHICRSCNASLSRGRIPRLALANNLYRGNLPEYFSDLTWVEEMACCLYRNTAYVQRLYGSSDPSQPRIFKGNICTYTMNTLSTAEVLPRTPADLSDVLSIVFVSPHKFTPDALGPQFKIRKRKVWSFLIWLSENNVLYKHIRIDKNIADMYPDDGYIPGINNRVIHDEFSSPEKMFAEEAAGYTDHPAEFKPTEGTNETMHFVEAMGAIDLDNVGIQSHKLTASALRKLADKRTGEEPDLTLYSSNEYIDWYNNPSLFPGMFPTLFPFGVGGFEDRKKSYTAASSAEDCDMGQNQDTGSGENQNGRPVYVSYDAHLRYLLEIADRSFRYHFSFMFVALSILQRRKGHIGAALTVRKSHFQDVMHQLTEISAETLMSLATRLEKNWVPTNDLPEGEQRAMQLLKTVNTVSANVPGSELAKIQIRRIIRNYMGRFGLPHLYFTFNPSAQHSPVFQVIYGDETVDLSSQFPSMPDNYERAVRVAKDPVAGTDFFNFMVRCLFEHLFGWDYKLYQSNATGGILGKLEAHIGTVECTERGGLHGHFLIWLLGGLGPSELREKLDDSEEFQRKVCNYFDSIIFHHVPKSDVFVDPAYEPRLELSPICKLSENSTEEDRRLWNAEFEQHVVTCAEAVQRHRHRKVCEKYGNEGKCRFQFPHELVPESFYEKTTKSLVLKCLDPMVNYYNPVILFCCRHNHDLKCILSGEAAKAAMFYIADYITKSDVKTHELLSLLSRAVSRMPERCEHVDPVDVARRLLNQCLAQYTYKQQLHGTLVARYVKGESDCIQSHQVVNMYSAALCKFAKDQYVKEAPVADSNGESLLDKTTEDPDVVINQLNQRPTVTVSQVLDYFHRPDELAELTFYDFCRFFKRVSISATSTRNSVDEDDEVEGNPGEIHAPGSSVKRRKRSRFGFLTSHPQWQTHELLKHIDPAAGFGVDHLVPVVTGMSIPRLSSGASYHLFALAHFKPFGCHHPLIEEHQELAAAFEQYDFDPFARKTLRNFEAIHECEDQRDKERLRKREQESRNVRVSEDKATEFLREDVDAMLRDDVVDLDGSSNTLKSVQQKKASMVRAITAMLLQCNWTSSAHEPDVSSELGDSRNVHESRSTDETAVQLPDIDYNLLPVWKDEIRAQEEAMITNRRNAADATEQTFSLGERDSPDITARISARCRICQRFLPNLTFPDDADCTCTVPATKVSAGVLIQDDQHWEIALQIGNRKGLNAEQWVAYKIMAKHFLDKHVRRPPDATTMPQNSNKEQLKMIMIGPGGTGKTHVVNALQELMEVFRMGHTLELFAPTGTAASQINGSTLHKAMMLDIAQRNGKRDGDVDDNPDKPAKRIALTIKKRQRLVDDFKHVTVAMIDEFWMTGAAMLCEIDSRLRIAKNQPLLPFGGVDIIACGDPYQFPPVAARPLYSIIPVSSAATQVNVENRQGRILYKSFDTVVALSIQQRMSADPEYAEAVLRLRTRSCNEADVELFNSRCIKSQERPFGVDLSTDGFQQSVVITQNNFVRVALNYKKAIDLCTAQNGPMLIVGSAQDTAKGLTMTADIQKELLDRDFSTGKLAKIPLGRIPLFVGMPVILRYKNISTKLGITNGSMGIVRHIQTAIDNFGLVYFTCVVVEFPTSKANLSGLPKHYFPLTAHEATFNFANQGDERKLVVRRKQIPIQPAFAITGHAAQGKTLPKIVCTLNGGGFGSYVAASRPRSRFDMALLKPVTLDDLNSPRLPLDLIRDAKRLQALEQNTLIKHGLRSGDLLPIPDPEHEQNLTDLAQQSLKRPIDAIEISTLETDKRRKLIHHSDQHPRPVEPLTKHASSGLLPPNPGAGRALSDTITGPIWDSANWSCAYDSVVAILLNGFQRLPCPLRDIWGAQSDLTRLLGEQFKLYLNCHTNLRKQSINDTRDNLRDQLTSLNPGRFPRTGPRTASADLLLETILLPGSMAQKAVAFRCGSCNAIHNAFEGPSLTHLSVGPTIWDSIVTSYQTHCNTHGLSPNTRWALEQRSASFQDWLDLSLEKSKVKNLVPCPHCHDENSDLVFLKPPPFTYVTLPLPMSNYIQTHDVAQITQWPTPSGLSKYRLCGVLYSGGNHFTANLIDHRDHVWTYDGQQNNGNLAFNCALPSDRTHWNSLLTQTSREAYILVYVLDPTE